MPSDLSSWLISAPLDGDSEGLAQELTAKLETSRILPKGSVAQLQIPALKTGTLDSLISLSEELPKVDTFFTGAVVKIVDTLRNLLSNDSTRLTQHILVNERTVDDYLFHDWNWNAGRYGPQRSLREIIDSLNKEMSSIDNVMKAKLSAYNLAKGSLVQMQRKKTGNLSVRSLAEVVRREDVVTDSEFMETVLVAVPKNSVKDWLANYERLASMVVPRSSHQVASDDEYTLFAAVVFKRVKDEFAQKCRENKYILRDFTYTDDLLAKQRDDLQLADTMEKELWTDLLRLARTNFSEAFQVLFHLKVVRLFVESVLRYGLPANYIGVIVKPDQKSTKKLLQTLSSHFTYLGSKSRGAKGKNKGGESAEAFGAEYQALMDEEIFDFVLFEIPWILT